MNSINFENPNGFPLEADATLGFMQSDYQDGINALAKLSGVQNIIVTGCEQQGNNVNPGWLLIDSELVRFAGGALDETIIIQEDTVQKANQDGQLYDRYTTRVAQFGTGPNAIEWDFNRVGSLEDHVELIRYLASSTLTAIDNDWVIVRGLSPFFATILEGVVIYKKTIFYIPRFEDGDVTEANPVYLTTDGVWSRSPGPDYLKFTPWVTQRSEDLQRRYNSPKGTLYFFAEDQFPQIEQFHFDEMGKGKNSWLGWAIADGSNGTTDLTDSFPNVKVVQRIS